MKRSRHSSWRRRYAPVVYHVIRDTIAHIPEYFTGTVFILAICALPIIAACFYR